MMRGGAGLDSKEARRKLLEERQDVATLQLTADYHLAFNVNTVDLKNRFGDVETNCRDRLHGWLLPNRGGLNSTHIHGTRVPVEEPSTASIAEVGSPTYSFRARRGPFEQ
jgi:hypothetical protein